MRTVHLLRKYDPTQWGGTETAIQRLFAGLREHDVESVVYCPKLKRNPGENPPKKSRIDSLNQSAPTTSSPSPPRSGGEGRGEVVLRAHGEHRPPTIDAHRCHEPDRSAEHLLGTLGGSPFLAEPVLGAPGIPVHGVDPLAAAGHRIEYFNAFLPVLGISSRRKRQIVSVGGNLMSLDLLPRLLRELSPKNSRIEPATPQDHAPSTSPNAGTTSPSPIGWGRAGVRVPAHEEEAVSIIHTHALGRIGGIARLAARMRRVPLVVTIHGGVLDLPPEMKKDFKKPIGGWEWGKIFGLLLQSRRLLPDADAIITCNENEARLLREQFPGKRVVVQPHGVPLEIYEPDQREHALNAFPQIRGKQVLLSVGRIDPIKNQGWLIEQAPAIFQKHPRALLVLAGACTDESYGEMLQKRIEALGLRDRVLLTGGLPPNDPRLIGLFQEAEVLLLPSKSETFGLVVLEAWATGTMVLSTRTSGACTLIRDGQNGWLFDLDKPETFHQPLAQALLKSYAARRMLRRGGDAVHTQYNLSALAGRMKMLYEELIEEKNAIRNPARRRHECVDAR